MAKRTKKETSNIGPVLESIIARIEKLEAEKAAMARDISDIYSEAKGNGLEPKIIREIVKLRRVSEEERKEKQEILSLYLDAIGMEGFFAN